MWQHYTCALVLPASLLGLYEVYTDHRLSTNLSHPEDRLVELLPDPAGGLTFSQVACSGGIVQLSKHFLHHLFWKRQLWYHITRGQSRCKTPFINFRVFYVSKTGFRSESCTCSCRVSEHWPISIVDARSEGVMPTKLSFGSTFSLFEVGA